MLYNNVEYIVKAKKTEIEIGKETFFGKRYSNIEENKVHYKILEIFIVVLIYIASFCGFMMLLIMSFKSYENRFSMIYILPIYLIFSMLYITYFFTFVKKIKCKNNTMYLDFFTRREEIDYSDLINVIVWYSRKRPKTLIEAYINLFRHKRERNYSITIQYIKNGILKEFSVLGLSKENIFRIDSIFITNKELMIIEQNNEVYYDLRGINLKDYNINEYYDVRDKRANHYIEEILEQQNIVL